MVNNNSLYRALFMTLFVSTSLVRPDSHDILFPTATGAFIGGMAGGPRGAAIGGAVGLGIGSITNSSRSRSRQVENDCYDEIRFLRKENKTLRQEIKMLNRQVDKLESKLEKIETKLYQCEKKRPSSNAYQSIARSSFIER